YWNATRSNRVILAAYEPTKAASCRCASKNGLMSAVSSSSFFPSNRCLKASNSARHWLGSKRRVAKSFMRPGSGFRKEIAFNGFPQHQVQHGDAIRRSPKDDQQVTLAVQQVQRFARRQVLHGVFGP